MLDKEQFHKEAYFSYWMVIECIVVLTTQGYNYITQILKIKTEILKNIYTLSFVQKN